MLSKTAAILLGLIEQRPLNAYELIKLLNRLMIKEWYDIADSTIYATMRTMMKKGFVTGDIEKQGSMPDKTVYRLTENGRAVLMETLRFFIVMFDYDTTGFAIGAFFLTSFPQEEALRLLKDREMQLECRITEMEKRITCLEIAGVPSLVTANVRRSLGIVQAEKNGTELLRKEVEIIEEWMSYLPTE